jgi:hypothetical protein
MLAAGINKGGKYIVNVDGTTEVVEVTRVGQTAHQKYRRTCYRCRILSTGKMDTYNDSKRFQRVAREDEIAKSKGEK